MTPGVVDFHTIGVHHTPSVASKRSKLVITSVSLLVTNALLLAVTGHKTARALHFQERVNPYSFMVGSGGLGRGATCSTPGSAAIQKNEGIGVPEALKS